MIVQNLPNIFDCKKNLLGSPLGVMKFPSIYHEFSFIICLKKKMPMGSRRDFSVLFLPLFFFEKMPEVAADDEDIVPEDEQKLVLEMIEQLEAPAQQRFRVMNAFFIL